MSSLPASVKIPLPEKFQGEMDFDKINNFIFSFEAYCNVVGLSDEVQKASLC